MASKILKQAFLEAQKIELAELPSEEELSNIYEFSDSFYAEMKKLTAKTKKYVRIFNFQIHKTAIAVLIFILLFQAAMSVEAFRRPIVDFIIKIHEKFTSLSFEYESEVTPDTLETYYVPERIPDGYLFSREIDYVDYYQIFYTNGEYDIIYDQFTLNARLGLDTENTVLKEINVNGHEGYTYTNKNTTTIVWSDGEYGFMISGVEDYSALKIMADSMQIKK